MKVLYRVSALGFSIKSLDALPQDLFSRTMCFTMANPPGIVFPKPMHHNVFTHVEPRLVLRIFTLTTGTQSFMLSFLKYLFT
jgi:hypothetical protein